MYDAREEKIAAIVLVSLGAITNLLLICALAHTWRHWRKVKWYIALLTAGNIIEVGFTLGGYLHGLLEGTWGDGHTCRYIVFMATLGRDLPAMAMAALAVHVLLTAITGNQGELLRHVMVLALFVVLSLPMPIAQIPLYDVVTYNYGENALSACTSNLGSSSDWLYYTIGMVLSSNLFPLAVIIATCTAALVLNKRSNRGETKQDVNVSDLVLTFALGVVLAVCCLPATVIELYMAVDPYMLYSSASMVKAYRNLTLFCFARPIITAVVCVIFGYAHAFRNRGEGYTPMGGNQGGPGERQKLVN